MSDIFISYKREERAQAASLAMSLQASGLTVWWDPNLRAGERFDDAIEQAIRAALAVVVMWSKRSVSSKYVKDEAGLALDLAKLVPVAIEAVELPMRFRGLHTHVLTEWNQPIPGPDYLSLLRDIEALRNYSASSQPKAALPASEPSRLRSPRTTCGDNGFVGIWIGPGPHAGGDGAGEDEAIVILTLNIEKAGEHHYLATLLVTFDEHGIRRTSEDKLWGTLRQKALELKTFIPIQFPAECSLVLELSSDARCLMGHMTVQDDRRRIALVRQRDEA